MTLCVFHDRNAPHALVALPAQLSDWASRANVVHLRLSGQHPRTPSITKFHFVAARLMALLRKIGNAPVVLRLGSGTHSLHSGWAFFSFSVLVNEPPEAVASAEGNALLTNAGAGALLY